MVSKNQTARVQKGKRSVALLFVALLTLLLLPSAHALDAHTKPLVYSSAHSVYLEWNASPDLNVLGYKVVRVPSDENGLPSGPPVTFDETFSVTEYADGTVLPGQYYVYQIQTLRAGMDDTFSAYSAPVRGQYLTVFVPDIIAGEEGSSLNWYNDPNDPGNPLNGSLRIPISTQCAYELSTSGMNIALNLPTDLIDTLSEVTVEPGGITAGLPIYFSSVDGLIRIASADAGISGRPLYGTGVLFYVYVRPAALAKQTCDLQAEPNMTFIPYGPAAPRSAFYDTSPQLIPNVVLESGLLCLGTQCVLGDADGDGDVDRDDVQRILDIKTGKAADTGCSPSTGDINRDRRVDSADAVMVMRWLDGKSLSLDETAKKSGAKSFANYNEGEAVTPEVTVTSVSGNPGGAGTVTLSVDAGGKPLPLAGFDAVLSFPAGTKGLTFVSAQPTAVWPAGAVSLSVREQTNGESGSILLSVSAEDSLDLTGVNALATLNFNIAAGADTDMEYKVLLQSFNVHDAYGVTPGHGCPGQAKSIVQGTVMAVVTDSGNDAPINNASVRVDRIRAAHSGTRGYYIAQPLEDGQYTLSVSAPGYASTTKSATVQGANQEIVPIALVATGTEGVAEGEGEKGGIFSCGSPDPGTPVPELLAFGLAVLLLLAIPVRRGVLK